MQSQSTTEITKAIIAVMMAVKNIEKNMVIGEGKNSYKGVKDMDVKTAIGTEMALNGLAIVPISVNPTYNVDRWMENTQYGEKSKQSIFCTVNPTYRLLHTSGEWIELSGYGHGVDTQDKAAGKATTYALKNLLLYTFMVPTGSLEDTDKEHSDTLPIPQPQQELPWLNENTAEFTGAVEKMKAGKSSIEALKKYFKISKKVADRLIELSNQKAA